MSRREIDDRWPRRAPIHYFPSAPRNTNTPIVIPDPLAKIQLHRQMAAGMNLLSLFDCVTFQDPSLLWGFTESCG